MNNKVLIKLLVPEIGYSFDVFIPVNEAVWKIKKMLAKSISDLTGGVLDVNKNYILLNKTTSEVYANNTTILNTDIRNITELILLTSRG